MRQWLADALRRLASAIDPPPPDWCELVEGLKREHEESIASRRIKIELIDLNDTVVSSNVVRLRK